MTNFIKRCALLVLILCTAASCSSTGYFHLTGDTSQYAKVKPSEVAVYVTEEAGSTYTPLGSVIVSADAINDANATVNLLRTEAARLGADAIVNMKLKIAYGVWGRSLEASGMAVKLND